MSNNPVQEMSRQFCVSSLSPPALRDTHVLGLAEHRRPKPKAQRAMPSKGKA